MVVAEDVLFPAMGGFIGALVGGFLIAFVLVMLAIYIYVGIALMTIAKKQKVPNGWLAFIPIANIYLITKIAKISPWWTLIVIAGIIPFVGGLVVVVGLAYIFWKMCEVLKRPGWWGILLVITPINLIFIGVLAWGKNPK